MSILTDVRYALRRFQASPGFVVVAALTLALGIGATTAIYSVVDSLMIKPLPYGDPTRLINVGTQGRTAVDMYFDGSQIADLRSRTELFAAVEAYNFAGMKTLGAVEPTQAAASIVGGALMRILAVPPQLGRIIDESDVREGRQVIVLGDALWRSAKRESAGPALPAAVATQGTLVHRCRRRGNVYDSDYRETRDQPAYYRPLSQSSPPRCST